MSLIPNEIPDSVSVPISVDSDGFLRRACKSCEREFKWLPSDDGEAPPPDGYHCPYCDFRADANSWFTKAQLTYLEQNGAKIFGGALMDSLESAAQESEFLSVKRNPLPDPVCPEEPDDMLRVDFACHPQEPLKIEGSWKEVIHCLICGERGRPAEDRRGSPGRS